MATSPFFNITLLDGGQANEHITANEAISLITILLSRRVIDNDLTTPPGSETEGDMYIPAATATGTWAGQENKLAIFLGGAYIFRTPPEGYSVWVADEDTAFTWNGSSWV